MSADPSSTSLRPTLLLPEWSRSIANEEIHGDPFRLPGSRSPMHRSHASVNAKAMPKKSAFLSHFPGLGVGNWRGFQRRVENARKKDFSEREAQELVC
jgi:hypothetical protein